MANRVDFLRKKGEGGGNGGGGANRDEERAAAYGRQPAAPAEEDPDPFADE